MKVAEKKWNQFQRLTFFLLAFWQNDFPNLHLLFFWVFDNQFLFSSHFDAIKTFKYWFSQNRWFSKRKKFLKMMKKFSDVWKDLAFAGKYNSPKNGFCSNCQQKCYIQMLHYWCRQHNFLLKCCKSWKNLNFCRKV